MTLSSSVFVRLHNPPKPSFYKKIVLFLRKMWKYMNDESVFYSIHHTVESRDAYRKKNHM